MKAVMTLMGPSAGKSTLLVYAPKDTAGVNTGFLLYFGLQAENGVNNSVWEFPKIGDPNIVPQIVGSLLQGPQDKVPQIFGNSRMAEHYWVECAKRLQNLFSQGLGFRV